jgi:hypothetical protein
MMLQRSRVAAVHTMSPLNPRLVRFGRLPLWSMWAWESTTPLVQAAIQEDAQAIDLDEVL